MYRKSALNAYPLIAILASVLALIALAQVKGTGQLHAAQSVPQSAASWLNPPFFLPVVTYSSGGFEPPMVAVADVNRDGKLDLIVVNQCANTSPGNCEDHGAVGVLLGNGDGTFQPVKTYFPSGGFPSFVAVADVNHDDKPDLVVANMGGGEISVLLGNGDGTFQPGVNYWSGSSTEWPTSLAVADLNGDGRLDVVVANHCPYHCGA